MWEPCRGGKEQQNDWIWQKSGKRKKKVGQKKMRVVAEEEFRDMKENQRKEGYKEGECEGPLISSCPCSVRAEKP